MEEMELQAQENKTHRGYILRCLIKGSRYQLLVRQIANTMINAGLIISPDISKPLAYLEELRMQYAAQLLRTTALRVNEIACSVGYLDALYFSRAFSRRMGLSPTAYRAAGLPSTDAGL